MLEEIKFKCKTAELLENSMQGDDSKLIGPTIVFKESVILNDGDELVIVCAEGMPVFVAIRRKK